MPVSLTVCRLTIAAGRLALDMRDIRLHDKGIVKEV